MSFKKSSGLEKKRVTYCVISSNKYKKCLSFATIREKELALTYRPYATDKKELVRQIYCKKIRKEDSFITT